MSDRFIFEVQDAALISTLAHAISQVEKPTELMRAIGSALEHNINQRFITKTDPAGNRWLPLAASTVIKKAGRGSLLELSGRMKTMHINAGDTFVEIGSAERYASFHETGTRHMPRRQIFSDDFVAGTLGQGDQADVIDVVTRFLEGAVS